MKILILISTLAAAAALALPASSMSEPSSPSVSTLTAKSSRFGRVLFDGRGFVLYAFTRDPRSRSACYGACAAAWPPYFAKGQLRAGSGVTRGLLGTTRRRDGKRQITYAGRPLYYYVGDRSPGDILCQNVDEFGGLWLVVRPNGKVVR